ncbi:MULTISPECIES: hypothetical protein [unclassified Aeromicrobium]|uniref:hypothetical protein n=1 Tax=unclassified Aeromicrobium TaxID=2633570 RepID=UPI00396B4684
MTSTSTIGFAGSPGTEVEPTCSTSTAGPSAPTISARSASKSPAHRGSGSAIVRSVPGPNPSTHGLAPAGAGASLKSNSLSRSTLRP